MFQQPIKIFSSLEKSYSPNRPINPALYEEKSGIWDVSNNNNLYEISLYIKQGMVRAEN